MQKPIIIDSFNNEEKPYLIMNEGIKDNINIFIKVIKKSIFKDLSKDISDLDELHLFCNSENINKIRLNCFKQINLINEWEKIIYHSIKNKIHDILGCDLAIQTKLNLSIQMPNDHSSVLEKHIDFRSGDSPFQIVIWIPLTDAFLSNSMFIEYQNNRDFIEVKKGDIVLFDPNYFHGNQINNTSKTRISINVRIKNWFSPDAEDKVPDRQFGIYYKDLCFSNSTLNAFKLIKNLEL